MFNTLYQTHYRANLQLALPIMFGRLSHILISMGDNAMVGQHSAKELAAASLANSFVISILTFGLGFTFALTPLTATASAHQDIKACQSFLRHSFILYPLIGFLMLLAVLGIYYWLPYFNPDQEIVALAKPYMLIMAMTMIPIMILQTAEQFMEGLSSPHEPMIINMGAALLNIILNYLLIYGHFGFPEMGLVGAGIATLITRIVAVCLMVGVLFTLPKFRVYTHNFFKQVFDFPIFKKIAAMGAPIGAQLILEAGAFGFAGIMVGWVSTEALAAHQIALNVISTTFLITTGISAAVAVRTAHFWGLADRPNMQMAGQSAILMGASFMALCGILIFLTKYLIPTFYTENLSVQSIAAGLLILGAAFQIFDGTQVVCLGALRGIGDTNISAWIAIVSYWLVSLPLGYALCFWIGLGAEGIWYGLMIGLGIAAFLLFFRFRKISATLPMKS